MVGWMVTVEVMFGLAGEGEVFRFKRFTAGFAGSIENRAIMKPLSLSDALLSSMSFRCNREAALFPSSDPTWTTTQLKLKWHASTEQRRRKYKHEEERRGSGFLGGRLGPFLLWLNQVKSSFFSTS